MLPLLEADTGYLASVKYRHSKRNILFHFPSGQLDWKYTINSLFDLQLKTIKVYI